MVSEHMVDAKENPDNPKQRYGIVKPSERFVSPIALVWLAEAMRDGADKYGPFNWRDKPVEAMTYVDAAKRHLNLWASGEEIDPKSGVHHLGHAMACMNILLDAHHMKALIDDRHKDGGVLARLIDMRTEFQTERQRQKEEAAKPADEPVIETIEKDIAALSAETHNRLRAKISQLNESPDLAQSRAEGMEPNELEGIADGR